MKTALCTIGIGDFYKGAEVLFSTLRKYGNLPKDITPIVFGVDSCSFAEPLPAPQNYYDLEQFVTAGNPHSLIKLHYFTMLEFDRIISIDADMLCRGDCSYLWSDNTIEKEYYSTRNTAAIHYFSNRINELQLNPKLLFNAGIAVLKPNLKVLEEIKSGVVLSYTTGDEGLLNYYYVKMYPEKFGFLPDEYNCCLDINMPQVPEENRRLVHCCGYPKWWDGNREYSDIWKEEYKCRLL